MVQQDPSLVAPVHVPLGLVRIRQDFASTWVGDPRNSGHQKLHRTSAKTLRPDSTPVAPSCSGAAVVPNSK